MVRLSRARLVRAACMLGGLGVALGVTLGGLGGLSLAATDDPVLLAAGDIAECSNSGDEATAALVNSMPGTVALLGDDVYPGDNASDFANCYAPSWGRFKARTRPASGNHEYNADDDATPYFDYFGAAAGPRGKGWYSYDLGTWHVVVLNSECWAIGGCQAGSAQEQWLRADLAAHPSACLLAYWHKPRFSSDIGSDETFQPFWEALQQAGADVVLNGHDHTYERFAPQSPTGAADPNGIRQFIVGTGGEGVDAWGADAPNSEVRNGATLGVLKVTLHAGSYDWQFVPVAGKTLTDSGSDTCGSGSLGPNLIQNPSFEQNLGGWYGWQASLGRVSGGRAGGWAARLTPNCDCSTYAALDSDIVTNPRQGVRYRATAWVRGTARPDAEVRLILRERGGANGVEMSQVPVYLDGTWQRLQIEHTILRADRTALDLFVKQYWVQPGDAFSTDDIAVNQVLSGPALPTNLIDNPSFEASTSGWYGWQSDVARVSGGKDGSWAAKVALDCACTEYTLDDSPDSVSNPPRGATYRATAWVKAAGRTGDRVTLVLREQGGVTGPQTSFSAPITLTTGWQQLSVSRTVAQAGRTSLDVHIGQSGAASGDAFLIDAISLVKQ